MIRRLIGLVGVLAIVLVVAMSGSMATAETVRVDPGRIANGRPILGTGQNLPPLTGSESYDSGAENAGALRDLYESGVIARQQREVAEAARRELRRERPCRIPARGYPRCRAMVVFDVDDTLVSTYPVVSTNTPAFTYDPVRYDRAVAECSTPVIPAVRSLYRWVQKRGLAVAVVSGRDSDQRTATAKCLRRLGMTDWQRLVTRPASAVGVPSARFKARVRAQLVDRGWRIVASVGDQVSDMAHGHLRRGYLLPNPMYWLP